MPQRLPIRDIVSGLFGSLGTAIRYWIHYTLVAVAWLGIVPLTAYRIYRSLFSNSFNSLLTLPLDMFSTENIVSDGFYGCCVVSCTLCAFISLVWLREQIMRGGGPDWLDNQNGQNVQNIVAQIPDARHVAADDNNANDNENIDNNNDEGIGDEEDNEALDDRVNDAVNENVVEGNAADMNVINGGANAQNEAAAAAQDWNPAVEWDRAAEELTWERVSNNVRIYTYFNNKLF
jgi:E3 ubiquitin-protein ligase MARCH6